MASSQLHITVTFKLDGTEQTHEITTQFSDMVRFDVIRNRKGFPKADESSFLFMAIVCYAALLRLGIIQNTFDVEKFIDSIVNCEPIEDADALEGAEFPAK
jgi:hypothetical protein